MSLSFAFLWRIALVHAAYMTLFGREKPDDATPGLCVEGRDEEGGSGNSTRLVGSYRNDKRHGEWTARYDLAQSRSIGVEARGTFANGLEEGLFEYFYPSGVWKCAALYRAGAVGEYTCQTENGLPHRRTPDELRSLNRPFEVSDVGSAQE
jgi:hypothetical protein